MQCQCGATASSECAQCHVAAYCSVTCQAADWENHRVNCNVQRTRDTFPEGADLGPTEEAFTWIDKHLALGDLESLGNDALMSTVKAIVSLGPLPPDSGIPRAGMAHFYVPIPDKASEDIGRYLEAAYQFIKASKGPVYLHCHAGISRSGTVAIYYWARSRNVPLKEAIRAIAGKRGQVWPNKGFLCQLEDALDEFRGSR
jgi:Dual specificity phosphatase, catalytic domain/MYND finger